MYHKFAESRIATGPLADRISKEDEDTAFEIDSDEYTFNIYRTIYMSEEKDRSKR